MSPEAPAPIVSITTDLPVLAGRYQLLDRLGAGGMGVVFRARDITLHRLVAIKVLPEGKLQDADAVARFRREALALAKLSHPHIIQAYDSGRDGDKHFLVMELVEGRSLAAELVEKGRLSPTRAADYVHQAALALQHAHQFGLVHRDVKPSNLLLGPDGRVRLLDLGLARFLQDELGDAALTRTGIGMGTPDYCSPEQLRDAHSADARSDIYSLGCTLYHLIAGQPPFPGSSLSEKAKAHETREPPRIEEVCPDIPGGLALVLTRMMAKHPADRFASMAEAAEALAPYVAGASPSFRDIRATTTWTGSHLATMTYLPRRRVPLPWLVAGLALLLALVAVGGLASVLRHGGQTQIAQSKADTERDAPDAPAAPMGEGEKKPPAAGKGEAKLPDTPKGGPPKPAVPDDPNVLTVSQMPEHGGRFRTINEALAEVKPGQTVRVLDDGVYQENLLLNRPSSHRNITVEAARGATLDTAQNRNSPIEIVGVSGVTVRNFRLRTRNTDLCALVYIREKGAAVLLERLDMAPGAAKGGFNGVEVQQVSDPPDASRPRVTIRDCVIRKAQIGINVMGVSANYRDPTPVCGLQICNNRFLDCQWGITVKGSARQVQVVGNRFHGCIRAAWQLENLREDSDNILLANNTAFECNNLFRIWDDKVRTKGIRLANNLALGGPYPDTLVFDSGGSPTIARAYGDATPYLDRWTFSHNWREVKPPSGPGTKPDGWIPPGAKDVCKERIEGVNRDLKSPDFLRPAKDSPLAIEGAGQEDPSLPTYIGAVPPEGVTAWDWDRTWRMPKDAQLLTVSKESAGGGKYRAINDALKDARPWATIRVLDKSEYKECLSLKGKAKHEGIVLEAPKRATLVMAVEERYAVEVRDVPFLRIAGFRFRDLDDKLHLGRSFVFASGDVPGTTFAHLDMRADSAVIGIVLQQVRADRKPLTVERCSIDMLNDGIAVIGRLAAGTCRGVRLSENRVRARQTRGMNIVGALEDIQVTGNIVWGSGQAGIQIDELDASSRRLLIANNTMANCEIGFRVTENNTPKNHVAGQVEVFNNLMLNCRVTDAGYIIFTSKGGNHMGNGEELVKAWSFRGNARDMSSGTVADRQLPLVSTDRPLAESDLLSTDVQTPERIRPASGSPLVTFGSGSGPGLPAYVGALPPEGVEPWDWERTWRMRMKPKDTKPPR